MSELEVLEHQIAELDNDLLLKLRVWFNELTKTRLEDIYLAEQAEHTLKTGFVGCDETLERLQTRLNAET